MDDAKDPRDAKPKERSGNPAARKRALWIAGVVVLGGIVAGFFVYLHERHFESTDDAFIDGHIIPISARVAGNVLTVNVDDNQTVKAGETLVEIDPADYRAKLAEMRAKVLAADAEAKRSTLDVTRYQELYKHDEITRQQLDNAVAQAASEKAAVEQQTAVLKQAELNLSYTTIVAPEDGRVTRKTVEAGSYVQVGQTLLSLVPKEVWIVANFKETQLTYMRPGQPVTLHADAYPDHDFHGHVDSIQSGTGARFSLLPPENATGNYVKVVQRVPVKIVLDDPADAHFLLAPGMSVVPRVRVR